MVLLGTKISEVAVPEPSLVKAGLEPINPEEPLVSAAARMLESGDYAIPTTDGRVILVESVLNALGSTPHLAKREARLVMSPVQSVPEERIHNIHNIARKSEYPVFPVVNSTGHLIAVWHDGKIVRKPNFARPGTRIKLIIPKVLEHPVVIVDRHRKPVGIIGIKELLRLCLDYVEAKPPVFYSGLEDCGADASEIKQRLETLLEKIGKIVRINFAALHIKRARNFVMKLKVSTKWKMYTVSREGRNPLRILDEITDLVEEEVLEDKEKRLKFRE